MFIQAISFLEKLKMPGTHNYKEWKSRKTIIDSLDGFSHWLKFFAHEERIENEAYVGHLILLFRLLAMNLSGEKPIKRDVVDTAVRAFLARDFINASDLNLNEWKPDEEDEKKNLLAIMPPMSFEDTQKPIPKKREETGLFEGILDEAGSKESATDSPVKNWAAAAAAPPKPVPIPEPVVGPVEKKITGVLAADDVGYYITTGGEDKSYLRLGLETDIPEQSVVTFTRVLDDEGHFTEGEIERTVLTGEVSKFTFQGRIHYKVTVGDQDYRADTRKFGRELEERYGNGDEPVHVRFYAHQFLNNDGFVKTEDRGRKLLPNVSEILMD